MVYMLSWKLTSQGLYAPLREGGGQGYEQVNKQLISERELECPARRSLSSVGGGVGPLIHLPSTCVVHSDWQEERASSPAGLVSRLVTK